MRVAVGLGNPGARYANTRHNLGFCVVDLLSSEYGGKWQDGAASLTSEVAIGDEGVLLVKPQTYMNDSGSAVLGAMHGSGVVVADTLVVVDDVNLDPGALRFRRRGSDGGHNGLRSIIDTVGSPAFPRLRLGVGMPPEGLDLIDFVLSEFEPGEADLVAEQIQQAARGVVYWVGMGIDAAMNRYNSG